MDTATSAGYERLPDGRLRPPRIFTDAAHEGPFWDRGYVKLPLLSQLDLDALAAELTALAPFDGFDPRTLENPRCTYHCTFLDPDHSYRRAADQLVRDTFARRIAEHVPGYQILTSNIYVKPPGTGRFEIHQNWPTLDDLDVPTITVWMPLQDTGFGNGTIRLVPGSHRVFPDAAAASSDRFFDDFESDLIESYLRPIEVRAGEALIFDDSLLHWSGDNRSDSPRISFQIEMVPTGARTVLWIRNPDDPDEFELWESSSEFYIDSDIEAVLGRPEGLPFVASVPNPNRRLTLAEFDETMRRAGQIRRAKFALD